MTTGSRYWLDLFTGTTWKQFREAGASVSGFRESRWKTVQRIKPGDFLLCYVTGIMRWVGLLEVTSDAYQDSSPIWGDEVFPSRLHVSPLIALDPEYGVPLFSLRDKLSFFRNMSSPVAWTGQFRGSPKEFKREDGGIIAAALKAAEANPQARPFDERKLLRKPRPLRSAVGAVVIPEPEPSLATPDSQLRAPPHTVALPAEESEHTEIQWMLVRLISGVLGSRMPTTAYKGIWLAIYFPSTENPNRTLPGMPPHRP